MAFFIYPPNAGSTLPAGAATAANQLLEIQELQDLNAKDYATETTLSAINTKTPALGQGLMAASVPVAIASDQPAIPVTVGSSTLPTGAATEATLAALNAKVTAVDTTGKATAANQSSQITEAQSTNTKLDTLNAKDFATQTTLAALNAKVTAVDTSAVVVSSSVLPTGAATETTLAAMSAKLPATLGQKTSANSMAVVLASDQSNVGVLTKNSLVGVVYDAIGVNLSGGTTDVYTYYTGGLAGTLVRTVTITYTDSTKSVLQSVVGT